MLGACQKRIHVLSTSGKVHGRGPREKLWGVLREYGIDGCLLLAVKLLHFCSENCVRVDGVKVQPFIVGVVLDNGLCCHLSFS